MIRSVLTATVAAVALAVPAMGQDAVLKSTLYDYRVVKVVDSLINPWGMAFLPSGDLLVTERPGRLRIVRAGKLVATPVVGVPTVWVRGQGGLLDIALHPAFATNRLLYLSFSKPLADGTASTAIVRGRFENDALTDVQEIFLADTKGAGHFGSRFAFDRNGFLFVTIGDRQVPPTGNLEAHPAQDLSNHHGKIIRIHDDGKVPADNPFVGRAGAKPEIWSYGHRNSQGFAFNHETGDLWSTEHGPQGGDELNLITRGANYGWPVIGFGVNYGPGNTIHSSSTHAGMEQPRHVWVPSIGTSGLMVYTGSKFPLWKGSIFAGGLVGEQLVRLTTEGQVVERADVLVRKQGRIRDVRQGPDGFIYLAIDDRQGKPSAIVRLEPVVRR